MTVSSCSVGLVWLSSALHKICMSSSPSGSDGWELFLAVLLEVCFDMLLTFGRLLLLICVEVDHQRRRGVLRCKLVGSWVVLQLPLLWHIVSRHLLAWGRNFVSPVLPCSCIYFFGVQ